MANKRVKILPISHELLVDVITQRGGRLRVITGTGFPDDAAIEWSYLDPLTRTHNFFVSHPSFPEVPEGQIPEYIMPLCTVFPTYTDVLQALLTEMDGHGLRGEAWDAGFRLLRELSPKGTGHGVDCPCDTCRIGRRG